MLHIVNRLEFEAICDDESSAFEVRNNLSGAWQQHTMEVVEKICTKYVTDEEWIKIERLEIDLGYLSPATFENNFKTALSHGFEKEFLDQLKVFSPVERFSSRQSSLLELFVFFLNKGILPWWAEGNDFDACKVCHEILDKQETLFRHFLRENGSNKIVWKRMAIQLDPEAMGKIIGWFNELLIVEKQMERWSGLLHNNMPAISPNSKVPVLAIRKFIVQNAPYLFTQPAEQKTFPAKLLEEFVKEAYPEIIVKDLLALQATMKCYTDTEDRVQLADNYVLQENIKDGSGVKSNNDEVEKFIVRHAGIVLLSPFFPALFSELGLWSTTGWVTEASPYRAVHILHYLNTGRATSPEHNLGFEKLLCNMPLEEPLPRDIVLTEKEVKEAETLLSSVIEHWKVLKNSSVYAMRQTFIKRDGIVMIKDDGWLLQVEKKTEDVLLESVPWGYSTIHLPWNSYIIHVEW